MKSHQLLRLALAAAALPTLCAAPAQAAPDYQFTTLHLFNPANGEGVRPAGSLVQGSDGLFYGVTTDGGPGDNGTIFSVSPAGETKTVYAFQAVTNGTVRPNRNLVEGADGRLYGTTYRGGNTNAYNPGGLGTVFAVTKAGVLTTLHTFADGADGSLPTGGLVRGADGLLYGTTTRGGDSAGRGDHQGTVYSITPDGTLTILHTFVNLVEGLDPGTLVQGSDGRFYGVNTNGGVPPDPGSNSSYGTVFAVTTAGQVTTLHSFTLADGAFPSDRLVQGSDGRFYGVTESGGGTGFPGVVFAVDTAGQYAVVHNFSPDGTDGHTPRGGLIRGRDGRLYGTTVSGGTGGNGTVFALTTAGELTTLYRFQGGTQEGRSPQGALLQTGDGSLYGLTTNGGPNDTCGSVFRLSPTPAFFDGQVALSNGVNYLAFPANGNIFGYYSFLADPHYIYHFDLGYEYVFDAADGRGGVYLYDFKSNGFFYTSPVFPFPYLYDFGLNTVLYYYPDPNNPGRYNTNGVRYFFRFDTGQIIAK